MPQSTTEEIIVHYKWPEIFSIIPEFDGNQIYLAQFLNAYDMARMDKNVHRYKNV